MGMVVAQRPPGPRDPPPRRPVNKIQYQILVLKFQLSIQNSIFIFFLNQGLIDDELTNFEF